MFRLQDNVPEIYIQESRDFQLFCRLYDSIFNNVKFSIDSLLQSTDNNQCEFNLLYLIQTKVGLFKDFNLSDLQLRLLLSAYPTIMRYKGSRKAIHYILYLFQRMVPNCNIPEYNIYNQHPTDPYSITISFKDRVTNEKLLVQLLQLILPTGYVINTRLGKSFNITSTIPVISFGDTTNNPRTYIYNKNRQSYVSVNDPIINNPIEMDIIGLTIAGSDDLPVGLE